MAEPRRERPRRSTNLRLAILLLAVESVLLGTLSALLAFLGIAGTFLSGAREHLAAFASAPQGLFALLLVLVLGAGAFCGMQAILEALAGRLHRAFCFGIAASLLPPVQVLTLIGMLALRRSPEWLAQASPPRTPPQAP